MENKEEKTGETKKKKGVAHIEETQMIGNVVFLSLKIFFDIFW